MDEKERKKLDELKLVHKTVKGIMTCDVELFTRMHVIDGYLSLIFLEENIHKMRSFLVATKSLRDNRYYYIIEHGINLIVKKLERLTGKSVI